MDRNTRATKMQRQPHPPQQQQERPATTLTNQQQQQQEQQRQQQQPQQQQALPDDEASELSGPSAIPSQQQQQHKRQQIQQLPPQAGPQPQQAQQPPPPPQRRPGGGGGGGTTPAHLRIHHQPHGVAYIGPSSSVALSLTGSISAPQNPHHPNNLPTAAATATAAAQQQHVVSIESPLPPVVQRSLGDRSTERRKNAALEIEALIRSLIEANNLGMIQSVITVLSKDFCTSMNSNYRKGGLVGLAATAIGLMSHSRGFLNVLLPPVLHCFDDPESRVRYYACESLYNIAKVSRQAVLDRYFSHIWEGLTKLFADVDVDVKNGANLLDRLIKDIVIEADSFHIDHFLPLLQAYIRRTNPYIRQLIVGWITFLDSIPDISMLDHLPDFLDGLFNMLSDSNREIRQAADSALAEFLRELAVSTVVELGPVVSILVAQSQSKERLNRLTASTWLAEIIHHRYSGGDAILPFHAQILGAILFCISDGEKEIRLVAEKTNDVMLSILRKTQATFELQSLLGTLTDELLAKDDVPTKMACLRWINMLMEKRKSDMNAFTESLLPVLLRTLSDPNDGVVLLDLQALSRISVARRGTTGSTSSLDGSANNNNTTTTSTDDPNEEQEAVQFQLVLNAILNLFAQDRQLLETRGSLIIRKLCVLLNAKSVYIRMADTLASHGDPLVPDQPPELSAVKFISTMVQTLNIILLTASELHELRSTLASSFQEESEEGRKVFVTLFHCWCHNPVSTLALCLLARAYDLSFALVKRFSEMPDISVGFLMQIDKLVQLLESPIFIHLRLQLLDVESPHHPALLKSIYGLLMCLPQGDAFRLLNDRLTTVCNLRDNLLGINTNMQLDLLTSTSATLALVGSGAHHSTLDDSVVSIVGKTGLSLERLLGRFDDVMAQHKDAKLRAQRMEIPHHEQHSHSMNVPLGGSGGNGVILVENADAPDDETNASPPSRPGDGGGGGRSQLHSTTAAISSTASSSLSTSSLTTRPIPSAGVPSPSSSPKNMTSPSRSSQPQQQQQQQQQQQPSSSMFDGRNPRMRPTRMGQ